MTLGDITYRRVIVELFQIGGINVVAKPVHYFDNWYQTSWKDAARFHFNPFMNNRLCAAYTRYLNMLGISDSGLWSAEAGRCDRRIYAHLMGVENGGEVDPDGTRILYCDLAAHFMHQVCDLPFSDSIGYVKFVQHIMEQSLLCESP